MIPIQRPQLGPAELNAVSAVFDTRWLGMGKNVGDFERALGECVGNPRIVATNTGTSALHLALESCSLPPGSEVIVSSLSFIATTQAILAAGLQPVYADIEAHTCNIDPESIRRCITERTSAILPVHYRGEPCAMDRILEIAETHDLIVIEDAAHAFGSQFQGQMIGSCGHLTCFSFDPIKNITCGEGGAIAFGERFAEQHDRAVKMRLLGIDRDSWTRLQSSDSWTYDVSMPGFRYHMPDFCAAIGLQQLEQAEGFRARKLEICRRYDDALSGLVGIELIPFTYEDVFPFIYVIRATHREALMQHLRANGVDCGIHYSPNHQTSLCRDFPCDNLDETNRAGAEIVTIPLFTELSDTDVETVIEVIRKFSATQF
jgi:dTDP-4-amino-4,6-dideoxygalactose transaminase